jgi:two-component system invasion response regulator UvrY
MSSADLRILVANDRTRIRTGIIDIMRQEYPTALFGETGSGRDAITMALADDWDVVIVDTWMPDTRGMNVLRAIKAVKPALPVILTTMFTSPKSANWAAKAGALAYIAQYNAPEELLATLRTVLSRDTSTGLDAPS